MCEGWWYTRDERLGHPHLKLGDKEEDLTWTERVDVRGVVGYLDVSVWLVVWTTDEFLYLYKQSANCTKPYTS